jgi:hypothetical protein
MIMTGMYTLFYKFVPCMLAESSFGFKPSRLTWKKAHENFDLFANTAYKTRSSISLR